MAKNYTLCLIGTMDRLWFHQIILSSDPIQSNTPKKLETHHLIPKFHSCPSSTLPLPPNSLSLEISPVSSLPRNEENEEEEKVIAQMEESERKSRPSLYSSRTRSKSSSPLTQNRPKNLRSLSSASMRKMTNSMSCKSIGDLELEEIKGFMDMGFIFKKENFSPQMTNLLPGLKRLCSYRKNQKIIRNSIESAEDLEEESEEKGAALRPYLSEAWIIRRPDSPLLNLKMPKVDSAIDMKNHLRFWAKTVASEIQQES